jgi:thiol-disulfide isomerase/thioredoxin
MPKFTFLIIFTLVTLVSAQCFAAKITLIDKKNAPDEIAFFDSDGAKYFHQFDNKIILLTFWAAWSATSFKEMPDLDLLQKDFRKLPFEIIALSEDYKGIKFVQEYFEKQNIQHLKAFHDPNGVLFKAFSVIGLPTSFLINENGEIIISFVGPVNWHDNNIRKIILSHIPNNHIEPKNSYIAEPLNQEIKKIPLQKPQNIIKPNVPHTTEPNNIEATQEISITSEPQESQSTNKEIKNESKSDAESTKIK